MAIDARVAGRLVPFEAVQDKIAAHLSEEVSRKALAQYVSLLAAQADVQGIDLIAASTPLVR